MKKDIWIENNAEKEINSFPLEVRNRLRGLMSVLMELGQLREPDAKKLKIKYGLYELRVRHRGQWRVLYTYFKNDLIIMLVAFKKNTQRTPEKHIKTALKRLNNIEDILI